MRAATSAADPAPLVRSQFNAKWVDMTSDDADGSDTNATWVGTTNQSYFLITLVGPNGEMGPAEHQGL